MSQIEEFDEEIIEELRSRARNALLTLAISGGNGKPAKDLLEMDGMNDELANKLAGAGICTMEDLAEQATDELTVIEGIDEALASELIMTARAPWFADETASDTETTGTASNKSESDV